MRVKLISPQYVKPYVKRQKSDMTIVEVTCEAMSRPSMRFAKAHSVARRLLKLRGVGPPGCDSVDCAFE